MRVDFKFSTKKIVIAFLVVLLMLFFAIVFVLKPAFFSQNVFIQIGVIQTLGVVGMVYFVALAYSFLKLSTRTYAITITDDALIDHSRYESFGKIEWKNISAIQRVKKESIELFVNETYFENRKMSLLKKGLVYMHNKNYKQSIVISSALLDCNVETLYAAISKTYKMH